MRISNKKSCRNCFSATTGKTCPVCGYTNKKSDGNTLYLSVGTRLNGRYMIGGVIGSGGFGITYISYDTKNEKIVAVKEYFPKTIAIRKADGSVCPIEKNNEEILIHGVQKFYQEAEYVFQFNGNSNIVSEFDYFYANNTAYLVMEYLPGITLENYIKNYGALSEAQTVYVAERLAMALVIIHSTHLLHRDISPDNVMLCEDGRVKLIDFGAARIFTAENIPKFTVIMKSGFAPIEQYTSNGDFGEWTDIYSLGMVLYYALMGKIPPNPYERIANGAELDFGENSFDGKLCRIIEKTAGISSEERYKSASELKNDIAELSVKSERISIPKDYNFLKSRLNRISTTESGHFGKLENLKSKLAFTGVAAVAVIVAFLMGTTVDLHKKTDMPKDYADETYSAPKSDVISDSGLGGIDDPNDDAAFIEFDSSECPYNHFMFGGNIPASYLESFGSDVEITYYFNTIEPESNMYSCGFVASDDNDNFMIKYITGENISADTCGYITFECNTESYSFVLSREGIEALNGHDFGLYTFNLILKSAEFKSGSSMYSVNYIVNTDNFSEPEIWEKNGKKTAYFDFINGSEKNYVNPDGGYISPKISKRSFEEFDGKVAVTLELECLNDPDYNDIQNFMIYDCCMTPVSVRRFVVCPDADEKDEFGNSVIVRYDGDFRFPSYMTEFQFVISKKDIDEHMYGGISFHTYNMIIKSVKLESCEE